MNAKFIPYMTIVLAAMTGGYALHFLLSSKPTQIKAQTLAQPQFIGSPRPEPVSTASTRPRKPEDTFELPDSACAKLNGQGNVDSEGYFSCVLTNDSRWLVTSVRFHIAVGTPEGSTRWEQTYSESVHLAPGKATRIYFKLIDGQDVESRWEITSARGFPPTN